jgi:hypothetical protein
LINDCIEAKWAQAGDIVFGERANDRCEDECRKGHILIAG